MIRRRSFTAGMSEFWLGAAAGAVVGFWFTWSSYRYAAGTLPLWQLVVSDLVILGVLADSWIEDHRG